MDLFVNYVYNASSNSCKCEFNAKKITIIKVKKDFELEDIKANDKW